MVRRLVSGQQGLPIVGRSVNYPGLLVFLISEYVLLSFTVLIITPTNVLHDRKNLAANAPFMA